MDDTLFGMASHSCGAAEGRRNGGTEERRGREGGAESEDGRGTRGGEMCALPSRRGFVRSSSTVPTCLSRIGERAQITTVKNEETMLRVEGEDEEQEKERRRCIVERGRREDGKVREEYRGSLHTITNHVPARVTVAIVP